MTMTREGIAEISDDAGVKRASAWLVDDTGVLDLADVGIIRMAMDPHDAGSFVAAILGAARGRLRVFTTEDGELCGFQVTLADGSLSDGRGDPQRSRLVNGWL